MALWRVLSHCCLQTRQLAPDRSVSSSRIAASLDIGLAHRHRDLVGVEVAKKRQQVLLAIKIAALWAADFIAAPNSLDCRLSDFGLLGLILSEELLSLVSVLWIIWRGLSRNV